MIELSFKYRIMRIHSAVKEVFMSKKVLILSGSPRKGGNSDILRGTPAMAQAYEMGRNV